MPCFVRWPAGNLKSPTDIGTPTQVQDVFPTLIDLCALKAPENFQPDGRSLAGFLHGTESSFPDRKLVVQYSRAKLEKWESCVIWKTWRLVHGTELYDIANDPGQKTDVAADHAEIVQAMREHYEQWWTGLGDVMTDFLPISIGAPEENPVELSSSDWQDIYCDNQRLVSEASGGPQGGPWAIFVENDGDYEIALSRWPPFLKLPLTAGREEQKMTFGAIPGGKALPIAAAQLRIAGEERSAKADPDATSIAMRVPLKKGTRTNLHAWFQDAAGKDVCGAFYATVRRL